MFKKRHSAPGSSPATLVPHLIDGKAKKAGIRVIEYDLNHFQEQESTDIVAVINQLDSRKITWINIDGLGDLPVLEALSARFKIHPLSLEDVLNTGQRPKTEEAEDYLFIIAQMVYHDEKLNLCGEQVSMFLGR